MKRLALLVLVLGVVAAPAYWWFLMQAEPAEGAWPLDAAELRKAAHSIEGDLPIEVRAEKVLVWEFPEAMLRSGGSWEKRDMTCFAYQLVFPKRTAIIDTAMDEQTAKSELPVKEYDKAAWWRSQRALNLAEFSVVTHEHFDHIGGLLENPAAWERAVVNTQQLQHPELVKPLKYPAVQPRQVVDYQGIKAVAPGVVLIRTPGHTPGSQMVYVQRSDGAELLFLGDVSWTAANVEQVRERPRAVTAMMSEDRKAVLQQLAALHALASSEPKLHLVPGHDGAVVEALAGQGLLKLGFQVP
jgi:glyoxylase-like metal-dependent hydrolase (beta-lactamase superfamily II)